MRYCIILPNDWAGPAFHRIFVLPMKISSIPSAQAVVLHCKAVGIKNIVISPGSRNAPLTLGFTGDPFFSCYSIVDERCAAFFALGMAQQLRQAVAVVCTSGSAMLNYYPAIAEAFYSQIPLLVISADRPPYKVDIGDGQTIRQDNIFQRHIGRSALLKQDVTHATQAIRDAGLPLPTDAAELIEYQHEIQTFNNAALSEALEMAISHKLPVHVNVPLEEPLYQTVIIDEGHLPEMPAVTELGESQSELESFGSIWARAKRKMVLIGAGYPGDIADVWLKKLAEDPSVLVFTETTSNAHNAQFFPNIDSIIAPIENSEEADARFTALQPEVLLTMGGMIVSKKVKAFLRNYRPRHHWHIDAHRAYNTYFSLSHHFKMTPDRFFEAFRGYLNPVGSGYKARWAKVRERYRKRRSEYIGRIPFSDMLAFHHILGEIPHGHQVQLANSSTVRYCQLFDMHPSLKVFCNRGTSGIEGSTSTAIGASLGNEAPTTFISGDLSFLYDSNALWNAYVRPDFRILVINNQGGGIFRILPGLEATDTFETYFETTQDLDIAKVCELYGLVHARVENEADLKQELATFYQVSESPKLLEIRTPRLENNKILLTYFDFLS